MILFYVYASFKLYHTIPLTCPLYSFAGLLLIHLSTLCLSNDYSVKDLHGTTTVIRSKQGIQEGEYICIELASMSL